MAGYKQENGFALAIRFLPGRFFELKEPGPEQSKNIEDARSQKQTLLHFKNTKKFAV